MVLSFVDSPFTTKTQYEAWAAMPAGSAKDAALTKTGGGCEGATITDLHADIVRHTCLKLGSVPAIAAMARTCKAWRQALVSLYKSPEYRPMLTTAVALRFPRLDNVEACQKVHPQNVYRIMQEIERKRRDIRYGPALRTLFNVDATTLSSFIFTVELTNHKTWMGRLSADPDDRTLLMYNNDDSQDATAAISNNAVLNVYVTSLPDRLKTQIIYSGNVDKHNASHDYGDPFMKRALTKELTEVARASFDHKGLPYAYKDEDTCFPYFQPLAIWYANRCEIKLKFTVGAPLDEDDEEEPRGNHRWPTTMPMDEMGAKSLVRYLKGMSIGEVAHNTPQGEVYW